MLSTHRQTGMPVATSVNVLLFHTIAYFLYSSCDINESFPFIVQKPNFGQSFGIENVVSLSLRIYSA